MARNEYLANDHLAARADARKLTLVRRSMRTARVAPTRGAYIARLLNRLIGAY